MIRPLLACRWIAQYQTMPPTAFAEMLNDELLPSHILDVIDDLLERKTSAMEGEEIVAPEVLLEWISETRDYSNTIAHRISAGSKPGWDAVNQIMRDGVKA